MALLNQHIKSYNISKFVVYSTDGQNTCDLRGGIVKLQYVESILENYLKLSAVIADTGFSIKNGNDTLGVLEGLEVNGSQFVELKIEDGLGNTFNFSISDKTQLRVSAIRDRIESNGSMVFTLDLVSAECFENEAIRVDKSFNGKASDTVEKILTESLKTEKDLHIEETANEVPCIGDVTSDTPFSLCTSLGPRSIPTTKGANENSAGFFFFETYDGYNFKSIEGLLDNNRPYKKYIYTNSTDSPPEYNGKILEYVSKTDIDFLSNLKTGAYGTKVYTTNFFDNAYKESINSYKESINSANEDNFNILGTKLPEFSKELSFTNNQFRPTKIITKVESFGSTKKIDKDNSKRKDFNDDKTLAQSMMRYNQLYTVKATITIAGDLSHRAGDLIYCDFQGTTSSKSEQINKRTSGLYIIADLSHYISSTQGIYTKMNLVRDSFGRQPFK